MMPIKPLDHLCTFTFLGVHKGGQGRTVITVPILCVLCVVQPALITACFKTARSRLRAQACADDLERTKRDGQILEESLVWLTVFSR
jgi:hypothetical protein